jgi:predicted PurR-regulated permease PerM
MVISVPPVALALLDHGPATAAIVLVALTAINLLLSNFLEPVLMGKQLGLSPLVVFLSLVFWGWLWGPAGMLLAVPLTRIAKILLENSRELYWIGELMGRLPRHARRPRSGRPISPAGASPSLFQKSR